jgi:hypothetical protein
VTAPWPLEPDARLADREARNAAPGEHEIELSKAVSLKRIADALTGGTLPDGLHAAVTHMAWEAGQNFGRGIELGRQA